LVPGGANILVITRGRILRIDAASLGRARIVGARVAIVTVHDRIVQAETATAMVAGGTGVAIVARTGIGQVDTAIIGVAGIIGATIPVITHHRNSPDTLPAGTRITDGTGILIVAGKALMVRSKGTVPGKGVASGLDAHAVGPNRCRAGHHRGRGHDTLVGQFVLLADESAIAEVTIF
jgi:hypothetical protein